MRAESLRHQLDLLKKRYHVIRPEEFIQWLDGKDSLPSRSILLTCDDALRNSLLEMVPILLEQGLSCLFFATGDSADDAPSMLWYEELYLMLLEAKRPLHLSVPEAGLHFQDVPPSEAHAGWWKLVGQLSRFDRKRRRDLLEQIRCQLNLPNNWQARIREDETLASRFLLLNRAGLRQLSDAGMTIGAHSMSHPILARMPDALVQQEICDSRRVLEETLEKKVWAFGYPFGDAATITKREVRLVEQAGFRCGFMNVGGGFGAKGNRFAWPRVHVTADMNVTDYEARISSFYRSLRVRVFREHELEALVGG